MSIEISVSSNIFIQKISKCGGKKQKICIKAARTQETNVQRIAETEKENLIQANTSWKGYA